MDRRRFLGAAALGVGTAVIGGCRWRDDDPIPKGAGPYGALLPADANGVALPEGFTSRVVARTGSPVGPAGYLWHPAPDGGACFPDGAGWVYVSNSEVEPDGGASAIRFAADGTVVAAHRILDGTARNCAGGATPWASWLSCEEVSCGRVFETDPWARWPPVERPAMGRFTHEAAAVDPDRRVVYLTEDERDGCLYRFRPAAWPGLAAGALDALHADERGQVTWLPVPDPLAERDETRHQVPGATRFDGGEGAWYADGCCWFTTKGDNRVWCLDAERSQLSVLYGAEGTDRPLNGVDNVTYRREGQLFVAEESPEMEICTITDGVVARFLRIEGHRGSEVSGPAFSPDGTRLYFSSQRGPGGAGEGVTYEVRGPFHSW